VDNNFDYIGKTTTGPFLTHKQRILVKTSMYGMAGIYLLYLQTTDIHLLKLPVELPKV
jgi:hypothetical protein